MKIYTEKKLRDFEFWSGGADNARKLNDSQFDYLDVILTESCTGGTGAIDETALNDIMWFEFEWICEQLRAAGMPVEDDEEVQR